MILGCEYPWNSYVLLHIFALLPAETTPREQPHETRGAFFVAPNNPNLNNAKNILLKCREAFETLPLNGRLNGRYLFPRIKSLGCWKGRPYFNLISTTRQGDI